MPERGRERLREKDKGARSLSSWTSNCLVLDHFGDKQIVWTLMRPMHGKERGREKNIALETGASPKPQAGWWPFWMLHDCLVPNLCTHVLPLKQVLDYNLHVLLYTLSFKVVPFFLEGGGSQRVFGFPFGCPSYPFGALENRRGPVAAAERPPAAAAGLGAAAAAGTPWI